MYRLRPLASTAARLAPRGHVGIPYRHSRLLVAPTATQFRLKSIETDNPRVSDSVKRDHRDLEEYYNNMMVNQDPDTITRWQNQFVWELARHSVAEEIVVYPAFEEHCPGGHEMAEKDRRQHQAVGVFCLDMVTVD